MTSLVGYDLFAPRGQHNQWPSVADRIEANGVCHEWTGATNSVGYGVTSVNGRRVYVHRLVWEALVGPIPDDRELDHLCRNRRCCLTDHLQVVTHAENMRRGVGGIYAGAAQKAKTHCKQGHPFSGDNLYVNPGSGWRQCRTCHDASHSRARARKQEQT